MAYVVNSFSDSANSAAILYSLRYCLANGKAKLELSSGAVVSTLRVDT